MIWDTKKGGVFFFDIIDPPHSPLKKVGFKWERGLGGGVRNKNSLLDQVLILQGVKTNNSIPQVGYVNRPKKAQNGRVCRIFPYIRACVVLI